MLKNIKIGAQVTYSFCVILVLFLAFGLFTWDRLNNLDRIKRADQRSDLITGIAADIGLGVSESGRAAARFIDMPDAEAAANLAAAIERVQLLAAKLDQQNLPEAGRLQELLARQKEEVRKFVALYLEKDALTKEYGDLELAYHGKLTLLQEKLETRGGIEEAYLALRATEAALETRMMMDRDLEGSDGRDFDNAQASFENTQAILDELAAADLGSEERMLVNDARLGVQDFWQTAQEIHQGIAASRQARDIAEATMGEVLAQAATIGREAGELRESFDRQSTEITGSTIRSITAGIVAIIVLGGAIAVFLALSLSRQLAGTVAQARRLADNDLAVEITGAEGKNELAQMARALIVFKESTLERRRLTEEARIREAEILAGREVELQAQSRVVREIGAGLNRLANGDLTETIPSPEHDPFPAEYEALREAYNSVVSSLAGTLSRISDVADQVRVGSDEITSAAEDLSSRAETQAATLEESAAALNELTESVKFTAARAKNAEKTSYDNRSIAESGASVVRDAVVAMKGIEKSSDQITRIIGVIDDIAFQTNLLALNAGVEAARAGEAGRGFAVVASEVRGLAQRASESAREIKTLISESATQVETGSALVDRTGECLEQILRKAQDVSEQISAIAVAASEQSTGLGEITLGVNQLDQVTQQNAAVADATSTVAASLQQRADDLLRAFSGFSTGEQDAAKRPPEQANDNVAAADAGPVRMAANGEAGPSAGAQLHEF